MKVPHPGSPEEVVLWEEQNLPAFLLTGNLRGQAATGIPGAKFDDRESVGREA